MKKTIDGVKLVLLLATLMLLSWTAVPEKAQADFQSQTVCENEGHTCHAKIGSKVYHLEKVPDTY